MPDRAYTDADIDEAIEAITNRERLREAQNLVARTAPSLQRVLAEALAEGGWYGAGHEQAVREATAGDQPAAERARAVQVLVEEETRLAMLVGVAVGFELARELGQRTGDRELDDANQEED